MDHSPKEVLVNIFIHLDPLTLDDLRFTCRTFHGTINETVWQKAFLNSRAFLDRSPKHYTSWRCKYLHRCVRQCLNSGEGETLTITCKGSIPSSIFYDDYRQRIFFAFDMTGDIAVVDGHTSPRFLNILDTIPHQINAWFESPFRLWAITSGFLHGYPDGTVGWLKLNTDECKADFFRSSEKRSAAITTCASGGNMLVIGYSDGQLKCWDTTKCQIIATAQSSLESIHTIHFEEDILIVCDSGPKSKANPSQRTKPSMTIEIFDTPAMKRRLFGCHPSMQLDAEWIQCRPFDKQHVLLQGQNRFAIRDYDAKGDNVSIDPSYSEEPSGRVAFSPPGPGRRFAILHDDGCVKIYDFTDYSEAILVIESDHDRNYPVPKPRDLFCAIALSYTILTVGRADGKVLAYDGLTGERTRSICQAVPEHIRPREWWNGPPYVRDIYLHPYRPYGVIDYGFQLLAFDFSKAYRC